ncbi:MAG: UDP-N-acetylmuramate--L-alanine ligase [Candidatus Cloacimonetes bacterium]|nr:UDP-N-acetylmuramate--L-alanine ligase [Candidatus Cloacimonadota bacterium]MCF7814124.1 UDP-N-acetylmuramate--L-alanine ligase [Candidatus Cloacimonadota bacterium]MCF7868727.1 UDP-N-acetylmuramate--L-alanine ligase [Candidatus Cloacimonadota bacterium]MCF7884123.1 UDP-N-acetylmuramate--L-alanine ligase [Candidatus Cloacimonadota bacterium]
MLGKTKKIHFVGIGGIGMSGIAELLINQGFEVSGSDLNSTPITKHLKQKGAQIAKGHDPNLIVNADVVVKSSAVKDDNPEIAAALAQKIPVIRRAEMLSEIMRMSYGIGLAGTHGKTSTTSMVGSVLSAAALDPTVIVGGIVKNYGSNNLLGSGKYIVVEADEFDRSFLTLSPIIAGITNIEADHLDCYKDLEAVKSAFIEYANKVPFFGRVIACLDDHGVQSIIPEIKKNIVTYGLSKQANIQARNIEMKNFKATYTAYSDGKKLGNIELNVMGNHNILNSLLAVGIGLELEIPFAAIQKGLADYNGVFRRFEYKGMKDDVLVYDDYAHHPTEIEATLKGVRDSVENRIVTVFQPHLFSRTRDFYQEFGRSFFQSDVLVITPIYPARENPIPGITGKMIAKAAIQSGHKNVIYIDKNEDIIPQMENLAQPKDIFITMGAGNIYKYGESFLKGLKDI